MTDIHCHILPGVDDGARDAAESDHMLELAGSDGTNAMVATPHADLRYSFEPQECREMVAQLQERHSDVRLYLGCELHLTPENIGKAAANPSSYTLNGGDCILLELPDRIVPSMVEPALESLVGVGLRVIVAHPERNPYIQQTPSYSDRLVEFGCFLQLTARSLSGSFGHTAASTATYMLKRRLAHFVASDAHGATVRRPGLNGAFTSIAKAHGELAARTLMMDNPQAALNSSPISRMPAAQGWLASFFSRPSHVNRNPLSPEMR